MASPELKIYVGDDDSPSAQLQGIKQRVEEKYAPQLASAGRLRRIFLRFRMRHELETELNKRANSMALLLGKNAQNEF